MPDTMSDSTEPQVDPVPDWLTEQSEGTTTQEITDALPYGTIGDAEHPPTDPVDPPEPVDPPPDPPEPVDPNPPEAPDQGAVEGTQQQEGPA